MFQIAVTVVGVEAFLIIDSHVLVAKDWIQQYRCVTCKRHSALLFVVYGGVSDANACIWAAIDATMGAKYCIYALRTTAVPNQYSCIHVHVAAVYKYMDECVDTGSSDDDVACLLLANT